MIPYGRQDINQADIDAVLGVLASDFLTQGPQVMAFEQTIVSQTRADHAIAVNSATSALHIAVAALGLGPGDLLWTAPITFVASANCGRYCGADVDFVDIDPETFNMCPAKLERKLSDAALAGRLPKIILPVHMCGQSPNMAQISVLAKAYGVHVVEDASHAIGASYNGTPVGCCEYSDITVFSFHPVKIITTAEGGVATTNNPKLAERMRQLRNHGITRDPELMTGPSQGPWYYQQLTLGWNYRMTDLQAALGVSQMARLSEFVVRRNALAERYDRLLAGLRVFLPVRMAEARSSFHLYVIRLQDDLVPHHRAIFEELRDNNIGVNLHYIPVHLQPYYRGLGFLLGDFPNSENYYRRAISIPLYPGLTEVEQDRIVEVLSSALGLGYD